MFVFIEEVVLDAWDVQIALLYLGSEEGTFGDSIFFSIGWRKSWRTVQIDG